MENKQMQVRQGDVLLTKVNTLPNIDEAKVIEDGIMARGEATGHTHRIAPGMKAMLFMLAGQMYLRALETTQIIHEEHTNEIQLPPGDYLVEPDQQEYTPQGWQRVQD